MKVELNKNDFVSLVKSNSPGFHLFEHTLIKKCGTYNDSYGSWDWNDNLYLCSEIQLYNLYLLMKFQYD